MIDNVAWSLVVMEDCAACGQTPDQQKLSAVSDGRKPEYAKEHGAHYIGNIYLCWKCKPKDPWTRIKT